LGVEERKENDRGETNPELTKRDVHANARGTIEVEGNDLPVLTRLRYTVGGAYQGTGSGGK